MFGPWRNWRHRKSGPGLSGREKLSLAPARDVWTPPPPERGQLELPIGREVVRDRNADRGGRSFYFFDFDDNVAFLSTPIILFEKDSRRELKVSSGEYAQIHRLLGTPGRYEGFELDYDDQTGSFRCFRDRDIGVLEKLLGRKQMFVQDLAAALGHPDVHWKGPSWSCFYHATLNQRPVSLITARGHSPQTIREGIRLFVNREYLPQEPNYLSIFPVTNPAVRKTLGCDDGSTSVASLKKAAIRASVERALEVYGRNDFHRFGMSDDDPHNIDLITEEMRCLKEDFPTMSFFVIETQAGRFVKWEVFADRTEPTVCSTTTDFQSFEQLTLLPP